MKVCSSDVDQWKEGAGNVLARENDWGFGLRENAPTVSTVQDGAERSSPAEAGFGCLCFMALKCGKEAALAEGNPLLVVKNSRCARDEGGV